MRDIDRQERFNGARHCYQFLGPGEVEGELDRNELDVGEHDATGPAGRSWHVKLSVGQFLMEIGAYRALLDTLPFSGHIRATYLRNAPALELKAR